MSKCFGHGEVIATLEFSEWQRNLEVLMKGRQLQDYDLHDRWGKDGCGWRGVEVKLGDISVQWECQEFDDRAFVLR